MSRTTLLRRRSISVSDFRCTAARGDTPFVERYASHPISHVRKGSFGCRGRFFELVAGSILVGYPGVEFICTHDHGCGDECLWFFLTPELVDAIGDRPEAAAISASTRSGGFLPIALSRSFRAARIRPRRRKPGIAAARHADPLLRNAG